MPNIVILRGTSGSGKTTIALAFKALLGPHTGIIFLGPKNKLAGYLWSYSVPPILLLGRYESACGGCDAMSWEGVSDDLERAVLNAVQHGRSVLLEGLIVSNWSTERLLRLHAVAPLTVLHLDTPLDVCLDGVRARRAAKKVAKELNVKNTSRIYSGLITRARNQRQEGVVIESVSRERGLSRTLALLDIDA